MPKLTASSSRHSLGRSQPGDSDAGIGHDGDAGLRVGTRARHHHHDAGDEHVEHRGDEQRSRQSGKRDQPEPGDEHPARGADAVREVEHRERASRVLRNSTHDARAHQREGHAEQHGLRENQQRRDRPLRHGLGDTQADVRKDVRVGERRDGDEHVVKDEPDDAGRQLDDGVPEERTASRAPSVARSASAPSDMPPRKMTSTITCAYALCPTKSPR